MTQKIKSWKEKVSIFFQNCAKKELETKNIEQPQKPQLNIDVVICSACGAENSIRWEKKSIGIDDKQGSYLDLTFDFCEECGNVTNVDLS